MTGANTIDKKKTVLINSWFIAIQAVIKGGRGKGQMWLWHWIKGIGTFPMQTIDYLK